MLYDCALGQLHALDANFVEQHQLVIVGPLELIFAVLDDRLVAIRRR